MLAGGRRGTGNHSSSHYHLIWHSVTVYSTYCSAPVRLHRILGAGFHSENHKRFIRVLYNSVSLSFIQLCFSRFTWSVEIRGTLQDTLQLCSDGRKPKAEQRREDTNGRVEGGASRQKEQSDLSGDHLPPAAFLL